MREPSVGIVGYGLAGRFFHAPLLAATPGLDLRYVVTGSPDRAAAARADHPGIHVVEGVEALWGEIDLLVVATPNDAHVPLAEAALAHGVAVVVDKPMALDVDAALALMTQAQDLGVLLSVFHNRRWDSDMLTLRRLLAERSLGDVYRFESRLERWRPDAPAEAWRASGAAGGGGQLLDLGTHLIDGALWLFGPVRAVYAELATRRPGHRGDDDVFLALTHENGVISHLRASAVAAAPGPRFRVLGSQAAFVVEGVDGQEAALRAGRRPDDGHPWGGEPPAAWGRRVVGEQSAPVPSEPGDWPAYYRGLVRALAGEGPVPVDPADAVRVLEVIAAARLSASRGEVVRLDVG